MPIPRFVHLCPLMILLAACAAFEPPPTPAPTRALTGPTVQPSPVVRGVVPTENAAVLGQNDPTAAAAVSGGNLPPLVVGTPADLKQIIQITAPDGRLMSGELYSGQSLRLPGVLMIAPDSTAWLDLPLRLQAAGFTVLTLPLADVQNAADFTAALQSLSEFGTVDPGMIAVVGAEAGADTALMNCAGELLCDAVALISPTQHDPLLIAMQRFNPRSVFLAAGQDDSVSLAAARAIEDYAQGRAALEMGVGANRGAALIQANPVIGDRLIEWLRGEFAG